MQRHYVMVSLHIWQNKCKPLRISFTPICPNEKRANLPRGFALSREKAARPIFSPMNLFQYYEMSYGLNVEMHKQVKDTNKAYQQKDLL